MANINIHDLQQVDTELNNFEPQELTSIEAALINGSGSIGGGDDDGRGKRLTLPALKRRGFYRDSIIGFYKA
jgi:hypothetical protein